MRRRSDWQPDASSISASRLRTVAGEPAMISPSSTAAGKSGAGRKRLSPWRRHSAVNCS